ncbi:Serine/threonine-protein kinase pkn1 [Gimesia panareensis]|uniref:Serine/threonine-protein kinase pkn1 n=1 Tax=Gimesia panareensis TaxID=2527978 RepID=A0A518FH04_9PLAN|nr:TIR domain-containing protein [Gimesia panareensis]QDV15624.1 Serine/threonine-protein kinase pkn1 [Gimesia panareensis]
MPRVFLSHTHSDKPFVRTLAHKLQTRGVRVWVDEAEIKIGDSLIEKIEEGILDSDYLAAILSPNSIQSAWVKEELRSVLTRQIVGKSIKVLPILIDDCEIPLFLQEKMYLDLRSWEVPGIFDAQLDRLMQDIGIDCCAICNTTGMEFVRIPEGVFKYGNDGKKIYLDEFWIGKYPLTKETFAPFLATSPTIGLNFPEDYLERLNDRHPATNLTLLEAKAYAKWAGYSIPTVKQWEKAARGDDGRHRPWGNVWDAIRCNCGEAKIGHTTPVDAYPNGRSPYGCYDMVGNVVEMTSSGQWSDDSDFLEIEYYFCKGGSFRSSNISCCYNFKWRSSTRCDSIGVRFVIENPSTDQFTIT